MSIVGAQGVSMSELTGMGLDRLNAMAQGQQPSIAPSYLVLAAIEQLKKGKAGEQTPMPQGTVKDRLLASINQPTPMQAGIGQMAPQQPQATPPTQKMAEGGSVERDYTPEWYQGAAGAGGAAYGLGKLVNAEVAKLGAGKITFGELSAATREALAKRPEILKYAGTGATNMSRLGPLAGLATTATTAAGTDTEDYRKRFGLETDDPSFLGDVGTRALGAASDLGNAMTFGYAGKFFRDKQATPTTVAKPTAAPSGSDYGREGQRGASPTTTPNADPTDVAGGIDVSSRYRGVGRMGTSPLSKYATLDPAKQASDFKLNIPNNAQLAAAAAKFSAPDAARMAELKGAEDRAGLSAFARGMVNPERGRGFGAVFGSAAADWNDAREKRADARREYEDKREQLGTRLGISMGEEAKQKYLDESKWGAERAQEANKLAVDVLQAKNQTSHFQNEDINAQERNRLQYAAHALAVEVRKDGLNDGNIARLIQQQHAALESAGKEVERTFGKVSDISGMMRPEEATARENLRNKLYRDVFPVELEQALQSHVMRGLGKSPGGITTLPSKAAPANSRGTMPGS